ncbi:site-specific integrase [Caballeronia sp. BCC1704]|uniref:site-specific integrase n=1 Tax=Caballeronia sp. BCC1704 TaxID=2676300 RepID=UPI00158B6005|nr:site-specific integrase [Caballeronia sp. BCC1704]
MSNLPADIQKWIDEDIAEKAKRLRRARFLKSSYESPVWTCFFEDRHEFQIDWQVRLNDGSLLTDPKNDELWDECRMFLCAQEHAEENKGREKAGRSTYYNVRSAMRIIDYFLLNGETLRIHRFALNALTASDVKRMLSTLAASGAAADIYNWRERLGDYLRGESASVTWDDVCSAMKRSPNIASIDLNADERELNLSDRELIYARIWIHREGLCVSESSGAPYSIKPNTVALSSRIYKNTIAGAVRRKMLEELCWAPKETYTCEYPRASVQAAPYEDDQPASIATLRLYLRVVRRLRHVADAGKGIPRAALRELTDASAELYLAQTSTGHYVIPSTAEVNFAFARAVDFFKREVSHIFSSYVSVARAACNAKEEGWRAYATPLRIKELVKKETREIGVAVWSLARALGRSWPGLNNEKMRPSASDFFDRMRKNEGLLELLHIAIGACLFIVGAVSGRRQGELQDLVAATCLDVDNRLLVFANRKTGYLGSRQIISRPIPKLAIQVISQIRQFHKELSEIEGMPKIVGVFCSFSEDGECVLSHSSMNRLLDRFYDYIEMPLRASGERAYIRQHQLRRFFVTSYYMRRAGTLDALSWYLGHVSLKEVDAYIDFDFSVEERERVQAHVAVEALKTSSDSAYERLRAVIESRFGSACVVVDESDAVEMFLCSKRREGDGQAVDEVLSFPCGRKLALHVTR